jgi:hypothetical protein
MKNLRLTAKTPLSMASVSGKLEQQWWETAMWETAQNFVHIPNKSTVLACMPLDR